MTIVRILLASAWILVAGRAFAQPAVEIVADLILAFPQARTNDCLECSVRLSASADGVRRAALFEHPRPGPAPARIEYDLALPAITNAGRLLFTFDLALSDGVKFGPEVDGVRFVVEVDGRRIFTRDVNQARWETHALDLTPQSGRVVKLALLTEGLGNTTFDWALWGQPRVLRLPGETLSGLTHDASGSYSVPAAIGVVAVELPARAGFKLRVKPNVGGEQTLEVPTAVAARPATWWVRDFNFPLAQSVAVDWEPRSSLSADQIRVAAYLPTLELRQFGPAHAVNMAGQPLILRADIANAGPGKVAAGEAQVGLRLGQQELPSKLIPPLAPGQHFRAEWGIEGITRPGSLPLIAELKGRHGTVSRTGKVELLSLRRPSLLLENERLSISVSRQPRGYAFAEISARVGDDWVPVGLMKPLFRMVLDTRNGQREWDLSPRTLRRIAPPGQPPAAELRGQTRDPDGVLWQVLLRFTLDTNGTAIRLHYEWKAGRDRSVRALWGPNLYVGDGTTGEAKSWALFPGLEYLGGPEVSSSVRDFAPNLADRRTPHPWKITVPLMAVSVGPDSALPPAAYGRLFTPDSLKDRGTLRALAVTNYPSPLTIALAWDPLQKWDGEHTLPSARFSSPNLDQGQSNHRLGLFLPSVPDFVPENGDRATNAFQLKAGRTLTLDATIFVTPGPPASAVREWLRGVGGLPAPSPWPRSFQEELDLCRTGFLDTVWDKSTEKWRHCLDLTPGHAPGFAALLWLDAQVAASPEARARSRERVELAARNMLRDGGPAQFISQANCHIMQWEFPFFYGHLPESLDALESHVRSLIEQQRPDGGWVFQPGGREQRELGREGDSVLGTSAHRAMTLMRHARITGDTNALAAGEKALRFMESFRVPRGGQTWECPMYEPDILAAAYAIRAYHDAWRVTGNPRWLHNAVYWAESGVPFNYLWSLPDKPMMPGASIPVFGSTFYTHTWLGVPVQWCGLVYAYHVWHLAQDLERTPMPKSDSPLPLGLNFSAADWKRVVELLTASALHQQEASGPRLGTYPDSITIFERKNPLFLNPEDILVNVLALNGVNPDVQTVRLMNAGREIVISSGATITNAAVVGGTMRFQLSSFPGEPSHTLVVTTRPRGVQVDGKILSESATPLRREPGWWWDAKRGRLYLTVAHASDNPVGVEVAL